MCTASFSFSFFGAKVNGKLNSLNGTDLNIDSKLSLCSDKGTPYVFEDIDTYNSKEFYNISKKIIDWIWI